MKIAVEGCAHGELDNIYASLRQLEAANNTKIDLLICCGDFQSVRNARDLESLACPAKYRAMNSFHKYYAGEAVAPYPTLFIGGNHEASNYLWELFYGGWVAPNIYFLGFAGVIWFGGVRIAGLSGIFKGHDYHMGHYERFPYNDSDIRSIYHVREFDVWKLAHLRRPVDVFLSHDWPRDVALSGDTRSLFQKKAFLREEIESHTLGSPPGARLLSTLRPSYWFSAHLHTKFAALVVHDAGDGGDGNGAGGKNKASAAPTAPASPARAATRFLALDKCLPHRDFLQVVEFPDADGPLEFSYDEEWLAITRSAHGHTSTERRRVTLPPTLSDLDSHLAWVRQHIASKGPDALCVPNNFAMTAPKHDPSVPARQIPAVLYKDPQTLKLMELLQLPYILDSAIGAPPPPPPQHTARPSQGLSVPHMSMLSVAGGPPPPFPLVDNGARDNGRASTDGNSNPEEIDIGEDWQDDGDGDDGGDDGGSAGNVNVLPPQVQVLGSSRSTRTPDDSQKASSSAGDLGHYSEDIPLDD